MGNLGSQGTSCSSGTSGFRVEFGQNSKKKITVGMNSGSFRSGGFGHFSGNSSTLNFQAFSRRAIRAVRAWSEKFKKIPMDGGIRWLDGGGQGWTCQIRTARARTRISCLNGREWRLPTRARKNSGFGQPADPKFQHYS